MKKNPAACRKAFRKICADLGRDLNSPECRPIRTHISRCPRCSARLDSMKKTVTLFRLYPTPPHRKLRLK